MIMPCSNQGMGLNKGFSLFEREIREAKRELIEQKIKTESFKDLHARLEAVIYALMNELERREDGQQIMMDAEKNGQVEIMPIWREHLKKDIQRMQRLLDGLSNDEKDLIKQILNGEV